MISDCFDRVLEEELQGIEEELGSERFAAGSFETATKLFVEIVRNDEFDEFLTLPAYDYLP